MEPLAYVEAAAAYVGRPLDSKQRRLIESLGRWLLSEAVAAGALGPHEAEDLERRHLADSVLFAAPFSGKTAPGTLVDLGTGAGLPGLVLAVVFPETEFLLVDRSARRIGLVRRAIRVLGLANVQAHQGRIEEPVRRAEAVVARAVMPPERLAPLLRGWLLPGGTAVVGGSSRGYRRVRGYRTCEIPPTILDRAVSILIMEP